jgi:hypothetical protein
MVTNGVIGAIGASCDNGDQSVTMAIFRRSNGDRSDSLVNMAIHWRKRRQ